MMPILPLNLETMMLNTLGYLDEAVFGIMILGIEILYGNWK